MPDKVEEQSDLFQTLQENQRSDINKAEWIHDWGPYSYSIPTQDQITAYIDGMIIKGTYMIDKGVDSQSDHANISSTYLSHEKLLKEIGGIVVKSCPKEMIIKDFQDFATEEWSLPAEIENQYDQPSVDIETDESVQWTSEQLFAAILDPQSEIDMPLLREMILVAEDTDFTIDQSKQLSRWLLSFAEKYRDSSNPEDEAAVLSAIRTGASMLNTQNADLLLRLLEPGHSIDTSLVTLKMFGRIFEAQPPDKVDDYNDIAIEVCPAAEIIQNSFAITSSRSAAIAQLAIYALAAMASSKTFQVVKEVKQLNVTWFTRQTHQEFRELRSIWSNRSTPIANQPQELLDKLIEILESNDPSVSGETDAFA